MINNIVHKSYTYPTLHIRIIYINVISLPDILLCFYIHKMLRVFMIQIVIVKCMDGVILYINIHVKSTDLLIKKRENEGLKYKVGYVRYLSKQSCPPKSAM